MLSDRAVELFLETEHRFIGKTDKISAFVRHNTNFWQCLFTLSAIWQMVVFRQVVTQIFHILSNKLTLRAAEGHVAPRVCLHLTLCEE